MRIGVVSDTHNNLKNVARIVELFNDANVDVVAHTGDITQAKTLDVMADLKSPLVGVFGNNDQERASLDSAIAAHGFHFQDPPYEVVWASRPAFLWCYRLKTDLRESFSLRHDCVCLKFGSRRAYCMYGLRCWDLT